MEALTAAPRQDLTDEQVLAILTGDLQVTDVGAEVLAADLTVVRDISDQVQIDGAAVNWGSTTAVGSVARDCALNLTEELNWGVDLVRIRVKLDDGHTSAEFYCGVFSLTTPDNVIETDVTVYQVVGYDRLYLLQREVGDSYSVSKGSPVIQTIIDVIAESGLTGVDLDQTAIDAVVPANKAWPLLPSSTEATQWLDIVNWLLSLINYDPLWCKPDGPYRSQPHLNPATRAPEFTFNADDVTTTIVGQQRTINADVWATPNKWIFVMTGFDGEPREGDGIYIVVNQSDGPTSIDARGYTKPQQIPVDAVDQATLESVGNMQVAAAMRTTTTLTLSTSTLPIAGQGDVIDYIDTAAGGGFKAQATAWTMPLDGSPMSWTLQAV